VLNDSGQASDNKVIRVLSGLKNRINSGSLALSRDIIMICGIITNGLGGNQDEHLSEVDFLLWQDGGR
jgi:hypothetical protein